MRLFVLLLLATGCPVASTPGTDKEDSGLAPDVDGDGFTGAEDCNDEDGTIHEGAAELCDGLDNDCDGEVDDGAADATVWYADADNDGSGDPAQPVTACDAPTGFVAVAGDCNDADAAYHPDAVEDDCTDPADYNCDGSSGFADDDGDGAPACEDCDDADGARHPGAVEVCNGEDDDCNSVVDDSADATVWYEDGDADGYGTDVTLSACDQPEGYAAVAGDCNDDAPDVHPSASEENCADPTDYNCDGSVGYADADGDGLAACEECDDSNPATYPGATESCNGEDDNCDGAIDEDTSVDALTFYADGDADTFGDAATPTTACAAPAGYVSDATDCDDSDGTEFPGADERCDGDDDDCDGEVDEASAIDAPTWYADADADGYGDAAAAVIACSVSAGYVADATDCDDTDGTEFPGADERCDGDDDDCDGEVDEDSAVDASTWYADLDGDGYGDAANAAVSCLVPAGFTADDQDCDDTDGAVSPAGDERCNGLDDNCDGTVDEGSALDALSWYADSDGDGFGDADIVVLACEEPAAYSAFSTDCDDGDAAEYPGAPETCDGDDDNCDGTVDEDSAVDAATWYADADTDGYGNAAVADVACTRPAGFVPDATDCNDADVAVNPAATEVCDGANTDEDCSGLADDGDPAATGMTDWYADLDADGYGDAAEHLSLCDEPSDYVTDATDCDDGDDAEFPGADELCDGDDDDCDGDIDEDSAIDALTWYGDGDGDGYGDALTITMACDAPSGFVADDTDCNDARAAVNPGATEVCDPLDVDEDCTGTADDADAGVTGRSTWYADSDGDTYGALGVTRLACSAPVGYTADSADCNDAVAAVNPGATEECDPLDVDEDCSGAADDADAGVTGRSTWYADSDGDSYGNAAVTSLACTVPAGYTSDSADCNDAAAAVNPGATEVCDPLDVDEDCSGAADDADAGVTGRSTWYADGDGDGYGDLATTSLACTVPAGYTADSTDCNDGAVGVNPAATEVCDPLDVDEDCSGAADDSDPGVTGESTWYADADGDGFGDASDSVATCTAPVGRTADDSDCDDTEGAVYPGAPAVCEDNLVNDCDTATDDCALSGTSTVTAIDDAQFVRTTASDALGFAVARVGDVDADGKDDLFFAGYLVDSTAGADVGAAYIYRGGVTSGLEIAGTSPYAVMTGVRKNSSADYLGYQLSEAGDFDNDGAIDVFVGAPNTRAGTSSSGAGAAGEAILFSSPASTSLTRASSDAIVRLVGVASSDSLGFDVAGGVDVNDDSVPDVIAGAYGYDPSAISNAGAATVAFGGLASGDYALTSASVRTWTGLVASDQLGQTVGMHPDLDGDGIGEVLIGAYKADQGGFTDSGAVYIIAGGSSLPASGAISSAVDYTLSGASTNATLGRSIANAGDVDGDGDDDLVVGADGSNASSSVPVGTAYVFLSPISSGSTSAAHASFSGTAASDFVGRSVDGNGDLDGDGHDDVLVGATGWDSPASAAGGAFLWYGPISSGSRIVSGADLTITGVAANDAAAGQAAFVGDTNADGFDDLLIGVNNYDYGGTSNTGSVFLYLGTGD